MAPLRSFSRKQGTQQLSEAVAISHQSGRVYVRVRENAPPTKSPLRYGVTSARFECFTSRLSILVLSVVGSLVLDHLTLITRHLRMCTQVNEEYCSWR